MALVLYKIVSIFADRQKLSTFSMCGFSILSVTNKMLYSMENIPKYPYKRCGNTVLLLYLGILKNWLKYSF